MSNRDSLLIRAEQALLGAVLSDPEGQGNVLSLVRTGDFLRPYHGQVLSAMQRVQACGQRPGPHEVYREIGNDPDLPRGVSGNAALLADLMQAAPRPGHAPAYAAMVIGGGVRRRIVLAASRMHQAAADRDLAVAVEMTRRAQQEVRRCQDRWLALPATVRRELPGSPGLAGRESLAASAAQAVAGIRQLRRELQAGGDVQTERQLAAIAQRIAGLAEASADLRSGAGQETLPWDEDRAAGAAEGLAVRHLIAGPAQIGPISRWLRPGHFAHPQHRAIYSVACDLSADGRPIDPVTVAWEASRRGITVDIAELSEGTGPFAAASARDVARFGVLRQIGEAARRIQASAGSRQLTTGSFLDQADQRLHELERDWPWPVREQDRPGQVRSLHPQTQHPVAGLTAGREKEAAG